MRVILQHNGVGYWIKYDNEVTGYRVGDYLENPELEEWIAEGNLPEPEFTEEQLKELTKAELKRQRDELIYSPLTISSGKTFDVHSPEDRENVQGAYEAFDTLTALAGKDTITWTLADSTEAEVTQAELKEVIDGFVLRKAQAFAQYQTAKAEL